MQIVKLLNSNHSTTSMKKIIFLKVLSVAFFTGLHAQKKSTASFDTSKRTVVITSAYKPVLKPAAKVNFSASSPSPDSSKPSLFYNVPAQNLFFSYQPSSLKPMALSADTLTAWNLDNFVKV